MHNGVKNRILIIDDELSCCTLLELALGGKYHVEYATDAGEGLRMFKADRFDLVLLDLIIGADSGLAVLEELKAHDPGVAVIMMTAFSSIKTSVDAMKKGAFTYLSKPLDIDELLVFIEQALTMQRLNDDVLFLSDELNKVSQYQEMVGKGQGMQRVYRLIDKIKDVDCNVIITGESGTGKELAARAIHFSGKRSGERFVVINCAAIPETLLEEELFGHKRGAFTSAMQDKKGKLEIADHGTVFLDEIGDMALGLQAKLLRAIQQKEFTPLGGTTVRKVDIRIIAATNRDLPRMVAEGTFREDLFYRLSVMNIAMPPLRERREDILQLCAYFIGQFNREQNKSVTGISAAVKKLLMNYNYPGNVRQLANILEYAVIVSSDSEIQISDLPLVMQNSSGARPADDKSALPDLLGGMTLKQIERVAIEAALKRNGGRRDMTAECLGISPRGLTNKIKEYDL